jgi:cysteine desulfurase
MLKFLQNLVNRKRKVKRIYFDHASATLMSESVLRVFIKASKKYYANGSSIHAEGEEVREVLYNARKQIAKYIKAKSNEIHFTASSTEANNIFLQGVVKDYNLKRNGQVNIVINNFHKIPHIISSRAEHTAILSVVENLEKENLAEVTYMIPKENGMLDISEIKNNIKENTVLVALSYVNSETGTKQNIREISKVIKGYQKTKDEKIKESLKNYNIYSNDYQKINLFVDATQAVIYESIDINNLGVDGLSFGSHKIGGPAGAGALYVRRNTKIANIYHGGGQEGGLRSGSENVPAIIGFAQAMKNICEMTSVDKNKKLNKISELKVHLINQIEDKINLNNTNNESKKVKILGDVKIKQVRSNNKNIYYFDNSLPHIVLLYIKDILGEEVLLRLDAVGIAVSTASACSILEGSGSNFLKSLGKDKETKETIRISFSQSNTKKEIDVLVKELQKIVEKYS